MSAASEAAARLRAEYGTEDPAAYRARHEAEARKAFAQHEVTGHAPGRWSLARVKDGRPCVNLSCEVAVLGGLVLVHGDIDLCAFGYYRGGPGDVEPANVVRWIGRQLSPDGTPAEKMAHVQGREAGRAYDRAVFRHEAIALLLEGEEDDDLLTDKEVETAVDALEEAFRPLEDYGDEGVPHAAVSLHEADFGDRHIEGEDLGGLGEVAHERLYRAWAVLGRLAELLDARDAAVPPCADDEARALRLGDALFGRAHALSPRDLDDGRVEIRLHPVGDEDPWRIARGVTRAAAAAALAEDLRRETREADAVLGPRAQEAMRRSEALREALRAAEPRR